MAKSRRDQKYPFDDLSNQPDMFSMQEDHLAEELNPPLPQINTNIKSFEMPAKVSARADPSKQRISRGYTMTRRRRQNNLIMIWSFITGILAMIAILLGILASNAKKPSVQPSTVNAGNTVNTLSQTGSGEMQSQQLPNAGAEQMSSNVENGQPDGTDSETTADPAVGAKAFDDLPPSAENPVIALTFDDGPSTALTPQLLDTLKEKNVKATFFLLGTQVDNTDAAIVQRIVAEGHEIANHSYSHATLTDISQEKVKEEIQKTNDAIFRAANVYPTLLRPPTGAYSKAVLDIAGSFNLPVIHWSYQSCPSDWIAENQNKDFIANYVVENAGNGHLVLLHDIHQATVEAIPAMIDGLLAKGYRFGTVSEVMAYNKDGFEAGKIYFQGDT